MTAALAATVPIVPEQEAPALATFDDLYRAEFAKLVGALHLYCGDLELAHDFVQEAMARACQQWDTVGRRHRPSAWVYRVAINLASSWFRRVAVARRVGTTHGRDEAVHRDPNSALDLSVRQAVAALPRRERQAVVLRYVADLSIEVAAEVMQCAPGTVKALTSRAAAKLRAAGLHDKEDES